MKMRISLWSGFLSICMGCAALPVELPAAQGFAVEKGESSVTVTLDGEVFTTYKFGENLKYPFFYPVNGPVSGDSVTVHNSQPFPHHSSLFFGCDHVNGKNFWQPADDLSTGQIRAHGVDMEVTDSDRVVLTSISDWARPGDEPIMRDHRRIHITAPSDSLRFIDFEITLEPLVDVRIRRNNHSLFAARMAPDLAVTGEGTLVNAEGDRNEDGTFGKRSPWLAGYGPRGDGAEGLAIFTHPENRWHPAPWFTRDYGFISPTPMQWLEEGHMDLPARETFTLRYRVVVFSGDPESADLAGLYAQYMGTP